MPGIDFRALRTTIDIAAVLDLLSFVPTRRCGNQLRGPCPLHRPGAPDRLLPGRRSFSVNLAKNAWRCFHCGRSGNQLDLWAEATGQPLYQAAIDLCAHVCQPVPRLPRHPANPQKSPRPS
jgi:DNA primase